jgi:hypothetical protein
LADLVQHAQTPDDQFIDLDRFEFRLADDERADRNSADGDCPQSKYTESCGARRECRSVGRRRSLRFDQCHAVSFPQSTLSAERRFCG